VGILTYYDNSYTVDHVVKGADFIHGYDENAVLIVSFEGIRDFSGFTYDGTYLEPEHCLAEGCNDVKFVGGKWLNRDGTPLLRSVKIAFPAASWVDTGTEIYTQAVTVEGGTANTLVALQPSDGQFTLLLEEGISFLKVDNNNGVFTAKAGSAAPSVDMTIQATLTEVKVP
jgi:hypothetical protein